MRVNTGNRTLTNKIIGGKSLTIATIDRDASNTRNLTVNGTVLTFSMLNAASRGGATLNVEHSSDLGIADAWAAVLIPDTAGISGPTSGVTFNVTLGSSSNSVIATISSSEASSGKLFGRLSAEENP